MVDKPKDMTSHDVVIRARKILGTKKIGHTGTLDKNATGLLTLLIGEATKLAPFLQAADKTYEAEIIFGITTLSDDSTGKILSETTCEGLEKSRLLKILEKFTGEQNQAVPRYSSVKLKGKKLYQLALEGKDFEPPVKKIRIYGIEMTEFKKGRQPAAKLTVHCSKGTYIRSLARDIGEDIGCGAHLGSLRRTSSGDMLLADAVLLEELEKAAPDADKYIKPMESAIGSFPGLGITEAAERSVMNGKKLKVGDFKKIYKINKGSIFVIIDTRGRLLAVLKAIQDIDGNADVLPAKYLRVFNING